MHVLNFKLVELVLPVAMETICTGIVERISCIYGSVNRYAYTFDNVTYFTLSLYIIGNITIQGIKLGNLTTAVSNFIYFHFM